MMKRHARSTTLALSALWLSACQLSSGAPDDPAAPAETAQAVTVPAKGTATTLDIASWNLEWFGDPSNGPSNEALQLSNVRDVIGGTDFDLWGLEEVVSTTQFNSLVSQLPGYAGFVANDPFVVDGAAFYSDFNNGEQKVGILYKTSIVTVQSAAVILTQHDFDFGGRPPLEIKLRATINGATQDMVVIVMHAKCCSDTDSYQRRLDASSALKAYLDATYPTQKVWVIGDWNDDVDTSITAGQASPYQNFVTDGARYTVQTKVLSDAGIASTVNFPDTIDHHMNTNDAATTYVAGSAEVYRVDSFVPGYGTTTSDHFPVLTRYTVSAGGTAPAVTLTAPNGGESFAAGSVQNIAWTSSGVSNLRLELSLDGGGSWATIIDSTPASAGSFAWTVPAVDTTAAKVRATDTASAATDSSDSTFAIKTSASAANVILNEILANEPGGNTAGEFVEIVNIGAASADLGGWTLSDGTATRHTFAGGTTLAAGKAIVVFAGASAIPAGLTGAVAASTGSLSLNNSGDTVTLRSSNSTIISSFTYTSALASQDGVSMNRSPDGGTAATFVLHNTLSSALSSPGTRVDGTPW
ncbi:MAG TPA: lamin tail domain-containing protein [Kofleriaceae bacterium]|nr:lamin tail domain-containing protein [Kofleriaceae bacterium]